MFSHLTITLKIMTSSAALALFISVNVHAIKPSRAACDTVHHLSETTPAQTLQFIKQAQQALQRQRMMLKNNIMFPMFESQTQREALFFQEEITDRVIFSNTEMRTLNNALKTLAQAIAQKQCRDAHQYAMALQQKITTMRANFEASKNLYSAKTAAAQSKDTLMMYRMMKSVNEASPIADFAHRLDKEAQAAFEAGDFVSATRVWQQAELTFNQHAFKEVVDGFKRNQNIAKEYTTARLASIRQEVAQYLNGHFVTVPPGDFLMGSNHNDTDEAPQHSVNINTFKLGKTEVPFFLWDLCQEVRVCLHRPSDEGWGRGNHPVINISYNDIVERFMPWLTLITGKQYRLPTEAEWEYAARAGSTTDFTWADTLDCTQAQFNKRWSSTCSIEKTGTRAVQSFAANAWGLFDMHGNVWEWVDNCYSKNYNHETMAPRECNVTVLRGGSWKEGQDSSRSSNRFYFIKNARRNNFGFRLVEINAG